MSAIAVAIIDDSDVKRETMKDELEFANVNATPLTGPFASIDDMVMQVRSNANVAVCDHHLVSNYAAFSGAAGVASLYQNRVPAVLVTQYGKADVIQIRRYRRGIPILITPREADPQILIRAWEVCRKEFKGEYLPSRRPWRTLIRIEAIDNRMVDAVLPGWNSEEVIRFSIDLIAHDLHPLVQPGARFFAQVNKGAEDQADLYFEDFEHGG